METKFYYKIF